VRTQGARMKGSVNDLGCGENPSSVPALARSTFSRKGEKVTRWMTTRLSFAAASR